MSCQQFILCNISKTAGLHIWRQTVFPQTKKHLSQTNLEIGIEVFVSALQDVEFRVVEVGILIDGAVSGPDKAAHFGAAFR